MATHDEKHSHAGSNDRKSQSRKSSFAGRLLSIVLVLIILGLLFAGLTWWREKRVGGQQGWSQGPLPVAAAVVEPREVPVSIKAVGSLRAVEEVMLAPEVGGRVVSINFEAGQTVKAGALLVQLFDAPERADLEAATTSLTLAKTQLERSKKLAKTGAGSQEILDRRRAERDRSLAEIAQLEARIRQKQIRAPFAGQLGLRQINLGQYLNAGDPVATLTALDKLFVDFALPQQSLSKIRKGASVEIKSDAWPERTFQAKINAIEPQIGEDTRNVLVQAVLDNEEGNLLPGMYVTASLVLPPQQNALVVPATAIMTSAQGNSAVVIRGENARQGGTIEIVPVISERRIGSDVVVESGLAPGDVIVTEGQLRLQPGASVEVSKLLSGWEE